MKKVTSILAFLFLTFAFSVQAQKKVVLAESFDENDGTPKGVYDSWDIKSDGGYVYIVYLNDGKKITKPLSLWIDRKDEDGNYIAYTTLEFEIDKRHTFATYDYLLDKDGDYFFQVVDEKDNVLAESYAKVNYVDGEAPAADDEEVNDDEDIDTYYYENSTIDVATSVSSAGVASGVSDKFTYKSGGVELQILYTDDKPIKTSSVTISIYGGKDYNDEIETYDVDVDPTWGWFKVKQTFLKKGLYAIDMYSEDDVFMNSAYIEIK